MQYKNTTKQVDEITQLIGVEQLINVTGSSIATGFQAATIRWFQQEERDIWSRVHQVLLPKDYLRWRMTGEFASDASDGSGTLLLDGQKRSWSSQILKKLDIDGSALKKCVGSVPNISLTHIRHMTMVNDMNCQNAIYASGSFFNVLSFATITSTCNELVSSHSLYPTPQHFLYFFPLPQGQ